jgi:SAM-dependent methyltransferase
MTTTRWAPYLERYRGGECRDRIFHDMILEDARARPRPLTILDIGCGKGFDTDVPLQESMARAADRYVGVEPDPTVTPGGYFAEVHRCFFEDAPVPPASVDVAFAIMVLEHLPRPQAFFEKLWDVLKDGGVFWGLTVDGRHWFTRASLWSERLKIKELYLRAMHGRRGVERYESYPAYYRSNTPAQISVYTRPFRSAECVNFARVGQLNVLFPRFVHPLVNALDRRAQRRGRPGTLLAVRVVK